MSAGRAKAKKSQSCTILLLFGQEQFPIAHLDPFRLFHDAIFVGIHKASKANQAL
jgi:hypothetical protein